MNRFAKISIAAISLAFFFSVFTVGEANAQNINVVLTKMDNHYKSLSSLKSNIKMDKFDSLLKEHDIYEGVVMMIPNTNEKKKMFARIDWVKPRAENLAIRGDSYTLYRPGLKQVFIGKTTKAQKGVPSGTFDFLNMSRAQLKTNYTISVAGDEKVEDGTEATHLILTPKKTASYKLAEIWVDVNGMMRFARITEKNGDTTSILLSNIEKNQTINAKAFTIDYPESTKIVK